MNFYLKNHANKKYSLWIFSLCMSFFLTGCGSTNTSGTQARTDLTAEHVRGLYSGMKRNDIEDLLGGSDKSLAEKESIEVYSLADGTTAVLRYREDTLMSAYLRDKNNVETSLFGQDNLNLPGVNGINETDSPTTPDASENTSSLEDSTLNNAADSATEDTKETNMSMESKQK